LGVTQIPSYSVGPSVIGLTRNDLPLVAQLEALCFPKPWSLEQMQAGYDEHSYTLLGTRDQEELSGYVSFVVLPPEMEILTVAVAPKHRERGLGRALVSSALEYGTVRGVQVCFLEVDETNTPALRLYESLGFNRTGKRRGYYFHPAGSRDAVVMRRLLS
jgi:[ribosomal protein S18]-alanine N-acetyltransferase